MHKGPDDCTIKTLMCSYREHQGKISLGWETLTLQAPLSDPFLQIGYATEGVFFISAELSIDTVSGLQNV